MIKERPGILKINLNTKPYNVKSFKYNKKNSAKNLEIFLNKRKSIQKSHTLVVTKLYRMLKKMGIELFLIMKKNFQKLN